ncbi:acyl-CoA thioesterase [Pseudonocardia lacus]|uniref:acyl-CoA thioesterase n=1 Tax=Pseudonocardia lacus TaxID=2835865 RepID=UPI001BDCBD04|nr:acyl-CoA thioesterase II [Pseudonocardia lacus]
MTGSPTTSPVPGAESPQPELDALIELLDLEQLDVNLFRGFSPPNSPTRVFGGQVAGQALVAAARTVAADRVVHSLHAYFIRAGDPSVPIIYTTEPVRDGRSFTTRRVLAVQRGEAIFSLSASFQEEQEGLEHTEPAPEGVPDPESLPSLEQLRREGRLSSWYTAQHPIDMRFVGVPTWSQERTEPTDEPIRVWMRAAGALPDDPQLHACMLTYASDLTLLGSVFTRHAPVPGLNSASLDHAVWFHRRFRADEWLLYTCYSPTASGSRGLATGRFTDRDGRMIATVVQEGLVRLPRS